MINRSILIGRLTKDPDLRYTPNGKAVASFTLAVNRPYKNKSGEQEADFINVVQWNGAENTANFLKKGSLAGVDGRIQTRSYETDNGRRYVTEVQAESVQFLEPKGNNSPAPNNSSRPPSNAPQNDPFANDGQTNISDDDLPF